MKTIDASICPGAVLLVWPTGGGKSSVHDVYSIMCAGVSLTITPLLSLGADQTQKILCRNTSKNGGLVHAYHLDKLRCPEAQKLLSDQLLSLSIDTDVTIFLFFSPQAIVNNQIGCPMIDSLITKRLLSMLCIDELHLFVQFGLTFRQEFALLQSLLFKKLRVKASLSAKLSRFHTTVPVLFMTTTCNRSMVAQIEKLLGLRFDRSSNIFWPSADTMHHRNVCIRVACSTYPLSSFKKLVGPALETSRLKKYIWYANTRNTIEQHTEMLGSWIDQQGFKSDVVSVTGAQMKEQKFRHINLFAATNLPNLPLVLKTSNDVTQPFSPQILTATSGAANAGLNSEDVFGVGRTEFKGRAGRRPNASFLRDSRLLATLRRQRDSQEKKTSGKENISRLQFKLERSGATWKRKTERRATP
jgi:superfamily II DNA helicase RecQ